MGHDAQEGRHGRTCSAKGQAVDALALQLTRSLSHPLNPATDHTWMEGPPCAV